ncbi:extracellular solute-binding protein [Schaalia sp. ZJ405]|uniref:ABC transporter substrate-binding protein n=1 Tax=Schaalia sp. ZJ405 TaxID=2709403 RepID=UPI0013ED5254|nr:extracellular solute-binding protein [Schaalia sp. ZJ405]QPK81274.1 extracellular solute-binding protein [Schaalia sp. ZJ405]
MTTAFLTFSLAACASPGGANSTNESGKEVEQDASQPLTVWVDSTRQPMAEAYKEAHPDANVVIETYDGNANGATTLQTKISLFNQSGEGWPDVVFSTQPQEMSWMTQDRYAFPLDITEKLEDSVKDSFAKGALVPCTVDDKIYCLRNDLAMNVTWYNDALFKEFGYEVPKTWEEWGELGEKVAAEHPGYIIGTIGDNWATDIYLWASQCPANANEGDRQVRIDLTDPKCTRVQELIDPLIANGSVSTDTVFSSSFANTYKDKMLMLIGPNWYGGALLEKGAALEQTPGTWGVAPALTWKDGTETTGNVGGGLWIVSRHSQVQDKAVDFVSWVTTSEKTQGTAPGYPANTEAAKAWLKNLRDRKFYVNDPSEAFENAAAKVWDGWAYTSYSWYTPWADKVVTRLLEGSSLKDTLPAFQEEMRNKAEATGYKVVE